MGIALEELIQRHGFYVATDLDHTYQHSPNYHNSGKITIDLTLSLSFSLSLSLSLSRRINNLTVKAREINNIKPATRPLKLK